MEAQKIRSSHDENVVQVILRVVLVAATYYVAARICIDLPVREGELSPVWIPSGIGLVAVLTWGRWMALGVFIGESAAVAVGGLDFPIAAGLALSNSIEPLVIAAMLHAMDFDRWFRRVADVLAFVVSTVVGAAVSATLGVGVLVQFDVVQPDESTMPWLLFWSSVVLGVILVAPVLLSWRRMLEPRRLSLRSVEALVIPTLIVLVSLTVFERHYLDFVTLFLLFPLFVWATLRFGTFGASASVLLVAGIGIWATVHGATTIEGLDATDTVSLLQGMLVVIAITNLFLTALLAERDRARLRARRAADTLERAESIAHIGSWEWPLKGGGWVHWSPELARILGLTTVYGSPDIETFFDVVHRDDRVEVESRIREAAARGTHFEVEHRVRATGSEPERVVLEVGAVQADQDGPLVVAAVLDLTEQKAIERAKNELISTTSHELRTPLTSIIGFADTLTNRWSALEDHERRQFVNLIRDQSERMSGMIRDTLIQSEVDAGVIPVARERVAVRDVIDAALGPLERGDEVEVECDPSIEACGGATQLEQIIANLVVNAFKYGAPPIQVRASLRGDRVELRVLDHGAGVPPEFEDRMFDRFTRAANVETKPGTGLGLSIVRGLAQANAGTIRYERADDVTAFILTIPAWSD